VLVLLGNKVSATAEEKEMVGHLLKASEDVSSELQELELAGEDVAKMRAAKKAKQLGALVSGILGRLEEDVERVGSKIGSKFRLLDADGDGVLSEEDVRQAIYVVLRRKALPHEVQAVMDKLDRDNDGIIDLQEVSLMASALARKGRTPYISEEQVESVTKPELLTKALDQLDDEEAVLWGSMLDEYRDRVLAQRRLLEAEKWLDRSRELASPADSVTSSHFPS